MSNDNLEVQSARNVQPLRAVLHQAGVYEAEIISARDIPDFGTDENYAVVMIKIGSNYFADSIIVFGDAPKAGEFWRFYAGTSFPLARKISDTPPQVDKSE